ncbi:AfsR/SARP family transcriptional regulator [Stackebrandtia nassauensis]|uniref:Transcriptional regulator, SARP family n=1 Tax=Stackebrandtia nassauensis (strain DSM 44728 / CIP 108903 / NRRL B-16338 / NBRC 102104 / LLR-40K-21) TaxID=446470 RepID=D3PW43_STANL|nr:BTAD domain-containing putative transcriptional regulator [Stackebrandtia nassauensis]ADD41200.1 transcriptional regulator, SARP family [Stackebrandtia nassauensis DSM 44728]
MDFRILGALEVWNGSERIKITGRLHPKILAGLLLSTGRTVSLPWLVDLLWNDDPPVTARRQVQNAVAALRRQLEVFHPGLVQQVGQEYRINIAEENLDLRRFESATRKARQLIETGRWQEGFDGFRTALALWRGPALSGFKGQVVDSAAARLNDMYLSTYEEYAQAALVLGEPERVIPKLQKLVGEHPLRQRLTARLMHALHQAHRTPEALRLFDGFRKAYADELGLDPGTELMNLHVRIVQDDPVLLPQPASSNSLLDSASRQGTAVSAAKPQSPVPAQLPTDVATFTGRNAHLAALDRLRDSGVRTGIVTAITGIGGVGKTALAVHWGHARRENFPDGQLYINLRGFDERKPLTPHEAISRLLRTLGQPANTIPSDLEEAAGLYRSLLADKRMLVVLDNARSPEQVGQLLPEGSGSLALVTSRNRLASLATTHGAEHVNLDTLSPNESLDLFTNILGPRALEDIESTRRVCALCGQLPLALRVVAANLIQYPNKSLAQLANELEGGSRLSQLSIEGDNTTNLTAVFNLSYSALSDASQSVFQYLGVIPGDDFTSSLAAAITKTSETTVQSAFQELQSAHLLEQPQAGRFRFHDLVREYTQTLASVRLPEQARNDAVGRLVNWYGDSSKPRFHEFNNVVAACAAFQHHGELWILVRELARFANEGANTDIARQIAESALQTEEQDRNIVAKLSILNSLAGIYDAGGDTTAALETSRTAASLLSQTEDEDLHGQILGNLGRLLYGYGEYFEAEQYLRQALQIAEKNNDQQRMMIRASNLGRACRGMGRYDEAESHLLHARHIATKNQKPNLLASILMSLGNLYCDAGKYDDVLAVSHQSLAISREIGATRIEAMAMLFIGQALHVKCKPQEALSYLGSALQIFRDEHRVGMQIDALQKVAELQLDIGDVPRARKHLAMTNTLIDSNRSSNALNGTQARILCRVHCAAREFEQARAHGELACQIFRTSNQDPLRLARSLDALGEAHQGNNDPAAARDCWTEALAIFTDLDVPEAPKLRAKLAALPTHP